MATLPPGSYSRLGPPQGIALQSTAAARRPTCLAYDYGYGDVAPGSAAVPAQSATVTIRLPCQAPQELGYENPWLNNLFDCDAVGAQE